MSYRTCVAWEARGPKLRQGRQIAALGQGVQLGRLFEAAFALAFGAASFTILAARLD